jgi:hypothetical protein
MVNLRIAGQALVRAFNDGFITLAVLFLGSLVLVLWLRKSEPQVAPVAAH